MSVFIRVWPTGGISMLIARDDRSWPWWCAKVLSDVAKTPEQRRKNLDWAERMATLRKTGSRRHRIIGDIVRYFVNTCDICGGRGIYISGDSGRCSTHRYAVSGYVVRSHGRNEAKSAALEEKFDGIDSRVRHQKRGGNVVRLIPRIL